MESILYHEFSHGHLLHGNLKKKKKKKTILDRFYFPWVHSPVSCTAFWNLPALLSEIRF